MVILTVEQIRQGLDAEFLPHEPLIEGFRLVPAYTSDQAFAACESTLDVRLPAAFRTRLAQFDFGNLTVGQVAFCYAGNYLHELVELNTTVQWWRKGQRPSHLIMIANSDPFGILLNLESGSVHAVDPELGLAAATKVALGFEEFLRGIGTVALQCGPVDEKVRLAEMISVELESDSPDFWRFLAT